MTPRITGAWGPIRQSVTLGSTRQNFRTIPARVSGLHKFDSDWSEVSAAELNRIQRRAHLRYYSRPRNFVRVARSIRLRQYPYILRRLVNLGAFRSEEVPRSKADHRPA